MIVDADVHIASSSVDGGVSAEQVLCAMDESGVDRAVCWLQPPYLRRIDAEIEYVRETCVRHPDRLIPFGWIDPHLGCNEGVALARRCLREYGFRGIKLNGAQNEFSIDNVDLVGPFIEEAAQCGVPVALHIGDAANNTHPVKAEKLARRWPGVDFLLVHMGGAASNMEEAAIEVAQRCPNMHLIGSSVDYGYVLKAIRMLGASRVMFGSDMPFSVMSADVAAYRAFLGAHCTREEAALVMGGNAARLLGLEGGDGT